MHLFVLLVFIQHLILMPFMPYVKHIEFLCCWKVTFTLDLLCLMTAVLYSSNPKSYHFSFSYIKPSIYCQKENFSTKEFECETAFTSTECPIGHVFTPSYSEQQAANVRKEVLTFILTVNFCKVHSKVIWSPARCHAYCHQAVCMPH